MFPATKIFSFRGEGEREKVKKKAASATCQQELSLRNPRRSTSRTTRDVTDTPTPLSRKKHTQKQFFFSFALDSLFSTMPSVSAEPKLPVE